MAKNPLDGFSALSIGAKISTLFGLLGFLVACVFAFLVYRVGQDTEQLKQLPEAERAQQVDQYLTRYGVDLGGLSEERAYDLVREEMAQRQTRLFFLTGVGAAVFVLCFGITAFAMRKSSASDQAAASTLNPAERQVRELQQEVLLLRGSFEARDRNPGAAARVRTEGKRLAQRLLGIDDDQLDVARRILKYEHAGWALAMVARVYDEKTEADQRRRYSGEAVEHLDRALELMRDVERGYGRGEAEAIPVWEWVTSDSEDLERCRYLRALALAANAKADGSHTQDDVKRQLGEISEDYLAKYPTDRYDLFQWALSDDKADEPKADEPKADEPKGD